MALELLLEDNEVEADEEEERVGETVPDTEPDTLGEEETVGVLLPDTLRVPLTLPLTVRVPDEDDEKEPLELGDRVPETVEHPDPELEAELEVETDGLCDTL